MKIFWRTVNAAKGGNT